MSRNDREDYIRSGSTDSGTTTDTDSEDDDPTTEDVVDFMNENGHWGRENAITVAEIADSLGMVYDDVTNYHARKLVKQMMKSELYPVGSCSDGYYIMRESEEVADTLDDLDNRIAGMEQRKQLVAAAWNYHRKNRLTDEHYDGLLPHEQVDEEAGES